MTCTAPQPTVTWATSAVRLACAVKRMAQAETAHQVVAIKDATRKLGLTPGDTEVLRAAFERNKARLRNTTPTEQTNEHQ